MLLKNILFKHINPQLMKRPKTGFQIPLFEWLKKDLRFLVNEYLADEIIIKTGIYNLDYVRKLRKSVLSGRSHYFNSSEVWSIIQFNMWFERWMV